MSVGAKFAAQFRKPEGRLGAFAGWIMAHRGSNRQRNDWTVQLLEIAPADRVLEFGCGPGLALAAAAARATAGRVVGVDHSPVMIGQARARVRKLGLERQVELRLGGLDALATLPGPFDKILSVNVVQFVPDQPALLAIFHRLLAPGGRLATTYMPRHRRATAAEARQMGRELETHMTATGFTQIRTEERPLKPVPAICVLGSRAP